MKKILIITTCFAPENEIGAIRISKLTKYLVRNDYKITVISPELHDLSNIDLQMEENEFEKVKRIQISQSSVFKKYFLKKRNNLLKKGSANLYVRSSTTKSIKQNLKIQIFRIIHFLYTIIRNYDWSREVELYSKVNYKKNDFDIVFSSYPSLGAHWSASYIIKYHIANKWIADFRDPINYSNNSNPLLYIINSRIQKRIVKWANIVTYISRDLLTKFPPEYHYKFHLLANGFDEDDMKIDFAGRVSTDFEKLRFCYMGSLYGGERKLDIVFKAIRELIDENTMLEQNIEFFYAGKEYQIILNQASKYALSAIMADKGSVSRNESLSIQLSSDLFTVVTWNTENDQGIITGKLFEGFLTKKNILGVVNGTVPNSEFKQIIESVKGGFVIEEGSKTIDHDFQDLKGHLEKVYKEKLDKGVVVSTFNEIVTNYSYKSITKKLIELFNNYILL
jgi:hypothetical protein